VERAFGQTELTLDGDLRELARLALWIGRFCRSHSLDENVEFHLNLALEELFANAIGHGGCKDLPAAVSIRLSLAGREILAEFADRGRPFDPADAPPRDLGASLEERGAGGLGLHFVRQIACHIEYHRVNGWNRIALRLAI